MEADIALPGNTGLPARQASSADQSAATINRNISVKYPQAINTFAVDFTGGFAALAGKKALYIVNLEQPREPIKTWANKWEASVVEWSPHQSSANWVATALNNEVTLWDVNDVKNPAQTIIKGHQRAVTDISWNGLESYLLATGSTDGSIFVWDVRDLRKPTKLRALAAHASVAQVKWNRLNAHTLASAQGGELRIWDLRKAKESVSSLRAHVAPINGVDWSPHAEHALVTCSQETKVKFWNTALKNAPPTATIQTVAPVLRARYTPFGEGVVTAAQKGDLSIRLWSLTGQNGAAQPVTAFNGHTDIVTAIDWRCCTGGNTAAYQLLSWSKDQTLKLWALEPALLRACGPRPSPAKLPVSPASSSTGTKTGLRNLSAGTLASPSELGRSSSSSNSNSNTSGTSSTGSLADSDSDDDVAPVALPSAATPAVADGQGAQFMTLEQEFQMCERLPRAAGSATAVLEKCNAVERSCVLVGRNETLRQVVYVKATFPAMYPLNAAPAFEVQLQGGRSTLPADTAAALKERLRDCAQSDAEAHRGCMANCLARMRQFMAEELAQLLGGRSASPIPLGGEAGALLAENIPCPRLAFATFSPSGGLLFFANFTRRVPPAVRTLEDISLLDKTELVSKSSATSIIGDLYYGLESGPGRVASPLPASTTQPSQPSGLTKSDEEVELDEVAGELDDGLDSLRTPLDTTGGRTSSAKGFFSTIATTQAEAKKAAQEKARLNRTVMHYRLIPNIMSIDPRLGAAYVLRPSATETCTQNANIAIAHGRADLAQLWSLLAIVADTRVSAPPQRFEDYTSDAMNGSSASAGDFETPWALHPFGKGLIQSLFRHYIKLRDLQTLALMSCVLLPPKIKTRRIDEYGNSTETYMKPSASALFALMGTSTSTLMDMRAAQHEHSLLLDPADASRYNSFRRLYAEILYRWGEQQRAAEVNKFVDDFAPEHRGVELGTVCSHCGRHSGGAYCGHCKKHGCFCAVCQLPVRGLSTFCLSCGHGGHMAHVRNWFSSQPTCPAGCGCSCQL